MSGTTSDWPARVRIHPSAFVAPGAVVVGDVTLGARASVWFHAVLRGDTDRIEIGEDTNVQDSTIVHMDEGFPALVGSRVTIGHRAIIHGCVIEDDCLIGMGAILLTGARIGRGSLIAAGALVREKQVIPPGSLVVGAPARVAGAVGDAHRAAIERGATHYAALARTYVARGFGRPSPAETDPIGRIPESRGPMSETEWDALLAALDEGPRWVAARLARAPRAAWARPPRPGAWSAARVLAHLRDSDRDVYLPRVGRVLVEPLPEVAYVDVAGHTESQADSLDPVEALHEWRSLRAELVDRLLPLGSAEWTRCAIHSRHGPFTLADMVRGMVEHDLGHRRQIAFALGACR